MQQALERMNIKLHDAISSLAGSSGMAIMRAIIAGERDPAALLKLCDVQIGRAKADIVKEALRDRRHCAAPGATSTSSRWARPCRAGITISA